MRRTILDCYTDEASGLGVPPYLGVYPRYIAGLYDETPTYLTIDDVRLWKKYDGKQFIPQKHQKTDITTYNLTVNHKDVPRILQETDELIIIVGVHVPGKYLSAMPGTIHELTRLLEGIKCKKILTGPATYGSQLHGGKHAEDPNNRLFDEVRQFDYSYDTIRKTAIRGTKIYSQIKGYRIIEIETSKGCDKKIGCSFCLEPIKNKLAYREKEDILKEIKEFHKLGARYYRLGKQACIYSFDGLESLLAEIRNLGDIKLLHIDNTNPINVVMDKRNSFSKTKALVKYCTEGNVGAFGIESFDPIVAEMNHLIGPKIGMEAIRILNEYGSERGPNGLPKLLPGLNIIFGLMGETKLTFEENMKALTQVYDEGMMLRRINIRQVIPFEGTLLKKKAGTKFIRKNKRYYYSWRKKIREEIDYRMLLRLVPTGTILHDIIPEVYDGLTTFCRQPGSYPLIVGVKGRLQLQQPVSIRVTGHMLRSITGEVV
ncbi:radical SAM protein [Candidatus Woesearchaeota archaeon]|nr:radical SAM protein [Candidatus Woesearchaeota archaeon]